ncbi:MAG: porphobilinogen synthase [Bacillota bacterium]
MINRPRRLRKKKSIRDLVCETKLNVDDFVYPIFVVEGKNIKKEIPSLPDVYHFSLDKLKDEILELKDLGIKAIMVFGVPDQKDSLGSQAYAKDGIVQKAVRKIKSIDKEICIITDICMCQFTDHGHCGILSESGEVLNDKTLKYLNKIAISHAKAGADMVAPSDMMDGRVSSIRNALDEKGYQNISIMAYSAKFSSNFYGPFRDAAHSAPSFGDRKSYQMDFANKKEAIKEIKLDLKEGADIVMVKPALSYLDIISEAKKEIDVPLAAYSVSGEYSMMMNGIKQGLVNEKIIYESILSIKRAGADIIITYFAKYLAKEMI